MDAKTPRTKGTETRIVEIEAAAKEVFLKKGYHKTSIDEIARLAGISKGTIYLYFKNKNELYAYSMLPMLEEIGRLLGELENELLNNPTKKGIDVIMGFYKVFYDTYRYDPYRVRIHQVYQLDQLFLIMSKNSQEKILSFSRKNIGIGKRIVQRAIDRGLLPYVNVAELLDCLWGSFLGIVQLEASKIVTTDQDHLQSTLERFFILIAKGLEAEKRSICSDK